MAYCVELSSSDLTLLFGIESFPLFKLYYVFDTIVKLIDCIFKENSDIFSFIIVLKQQFNEVAGIMPHMKM